MLIRFADLRLDTSRFLLQRGGEKLALRPKVFDLLIYLVDHRTRVVPREELVEWLWGTTAVGSGSLSGLVNELRKGLGERGDGHSSIRTVHARGYQFVAEVVDEETPYAEMSAEAVFQRIGALTEFGWEDLRTLIEDAKGTLPPDRLVYELLLHLKSAGFDIGWIGRQPSGAFGVVNPSQRVSSRMRFKRSKPSELCTRRESS